MIFSQNFVTDENKWKQGYAKPYWKEQIYVVFEGLQDCVKFIMEYQMGAVRMCKNFYRVFSGKVTSQGKGSGVLVEVVPGGTSVKNRNKSRQRRLAV